MPPNGWAPGVGIPALSCPCCAVLSRSAPKAAFLDGFLDQVFDIPPDRNQRQSWLCTVDDPESVEPDLDARMHIDDRRRAIYGANNRVEPVARGPHAAQIAPIRSNPQIRKPSRVQAGETRQQALRPHGTLWQTPVDVRRQHCDVGSDLLG